MTPSTMNPSTTPRAPPSLAVTPLSAYRDEVMLPLADVCAGCTLADVSPGWAARFSPTVWRAAASTNSFCFQLLLLFLSPLSSPLSPLPSPLSPLPSSSPPAVCVRRPIQWAAASFTHGGEGVEDRGCVYIPNACTSPHMVGPMSFTLICALSGLRKHFCL